MPEKLAINWHAQVADIAGPYRGNRKAWLARAARKSGVASRQIKALYYGECSDPKTSVAHSVLSAAEKARAEASELASQFETLAGAINAADKDFFSKDVLALIDAARLLRGQDRA